MTEPTIHLVPREFGITPEYSETGEQTGPLRVYDLAPNPNDPSERLPDLTGIASNAEIRQSNIHRYIKDGNVYDRTG